MKKNKKITENEGASISREPREKSSIGMRFLKIFVALIMVVAIAYFGFMFEVREGSCAVAHLHKTEESEQRVHHGKL